MFYLPVALAGLFGLIFGSFYNVVIYRLPKMMEHGWQREARDYLGIPDEHASDASTPTLTLAVPRSRCPACEHAIPWYLNIPLFSWLFLGGRCRFCCSSISILYPTVELLTGAAAAFAAYRWGLHWDAAIFFVFFSGILLLVGIDAQTKLLPDALTLPLLWLGLILASVGMRPVSLDAALWGAAAGYMMLWTVFWAFKLVTGKDGMGYGDFKMLAAMGAWFGWMALPALLLLSSLLGLIWGVGRKVSGHSGAFAFGPFIGIAGVFVYFFPGNPLTIIL